MTTAALQKMDPSPSLDSPWRFEADLRPHFDQAFRNVRSALRLSTGMSLPLIGRVASDEDLERYQEHTDRWNYTFIDCPEGSFPLGGGVDQVAEGHRLEKVGILPFLLLAVEGLRQVGVPADEWIVKPAVVSADLYMGGSKGVTVKSDHVRVSTATVLGWTLPGLAVVIEWTPER